MNIIPFRYNPHKVIKGTHWGLAWIVTPGEGESITGLTFNSRFLNKEKTEVVTVLTVSFDDVTGALAVYLLAATSAALTYEGEVNWQLNLVDSTGKPFRLFEGSTVMEGDV